MLGNMNNLLENMSQYHTVELPVWLIIVVTLFAIKGLFK